MDVGHCMLRKGPNPLSDLVVRSDHLQVVRSDHLLVVRSDHLLQETSEVDQWNPPSTDLNGPLRWFAIARDRRDRSSPLFQKVDRGLAVLVLLDKFQFPLC